VQSLDRGRGRRCLPSMHGFGGEERNAAIERSRGAASTSLPSLTLDKRQGG
jgi:hypothetical protein